MERRLRSRLKPTTDSWRVDETYVRAKGKWVYLYRAVDSEGANVGLLHHFILSLFAATS
jgi:transposase, IS6 family